MSQASSQPWWRRERVWAPLLALGVAALLLLPRLGAYGLWNPQEINVADQARDALQDGKLFDLIRTRPPLTHWLVGWSVEIFGATELGARLPLALMGLLGALATYALGARLRRPRVGAIAAIILVASPLYLFQSRQLVSDIGLPAGFAIAALGLAGLVWPGPKTPALALARDLLLSLVGMALATLSGGAVFGVLVPLLTAAIASFAMIRERDDQAPPAEYRWFLGTACTLGALIVLAAVLERVFTVVTAQPGQLALFGKTLRADYNYVMLLGGSWIQGPGDPKHTFGDTIEQVAFGMFPWSAIAPIAVFQLFRRSGSSRRDFGSMFLVAGCLLGFLGAVGWVQRLTVPVGFPVMALIAVAVASWLDELYAAKLEGEERMVPGASEGLPIAALFVFLAAAILALDLRNFPVKLAAVHLEGAEIVFPPVPVLRGAPIVFGLIFGGLLAIALIVQTPHQRPAARVGLIGGIATGAVLGAFLSLIYLPGLSRHLSYKNVFEAYFEHREGDEPLAVLGIPGKGPEFYAGGKLTQLDDVGDIVKYFRQDKPGSPIVAEDHDAKRAFVIIASDKLCALHELAVSSGLRYHVLDDESSRYMLLTNRMVDGEKDVNPLTDIFHKEPPAKFARDVRANYDDTIELLGIDMPEKVSKGSRFKVTLWLKVLKRPAEAWKVFLHFDLGAVRFMGDHAPARCGMTTWQPGDIIKDTFELTAAGEITQPRGDYQVWGGFFKGSAGVWYNMPVKTEPHDPKDRVPFGTIRVE